MKNKLTLITGASSGIGKAYAEHLASLNYGLILVARRKDVLNTVAADIKKKNSVKIETVPVDLSESTGAKQIRELIDSGMKPDALIHAAGFGTRDVL